MTSFKKRVCVVCDESIPPAATTNNRVKTHPGKCRRRYKRAYNSHRSHSKASPEDRCRTLFNRLKLKGYSLSDRDLAVSDDLVRLIRLGFKRSERLKRIQQAVKPAVVPIPDKKEPIEKTRYKDSRGDLMTVWWDKIGGQMFGSIETQLCEQLAEYTWPDRDLRIVAPDFDKSAALKHIYEVLEEIKEDAFPALR